MLVSYAADKGAKLAIEGGQAAIDAAQALFHKVIDRLKGDPAQGGLETAGQVWHQS